MARRYKTAQYTGTVSGAIEGAVSDVEGLKDDIDNWKSNMESASMEHMPKYDEVSECYDALEELHGELEGIDLDSLPDDIKNASITYTVMSPYGRKAPPRWMQLSNAESAASAAKDRIEAARDEASEQAELPECDCTDPPENADEWSDEHEVDCPLYSENNEDLTPEEVDWDTPIDELDNAISKFGDINFPGMY